MKLRQKIRNIALSGLLASASLLAAANPLLQLGILGGTYDAATQTIISSSTHFSLYAFLTPKSNTSSSALTTLLSDTYYISMAVTPQVGPVAPASPGLGSFTVAGFLGKDGLDPRVSAPINGTINVTADMVYGTPPMESNLLHDPGDLSTHSVFPTFFTERTFQFNKTTIGTTTTTTNIKTTGLLNTQDNPSLTGMVVSTSTSSTSLASGVMAVKQFDIDTTNIKPGYAIHFDLYNTNAKNCVANNNCGDIDVVKFAPYSHDAESITVPEPGTLLLLGFGLIGLGFARKSRHN